MDGKPHILGVDDSLTIRKALEIVLKPAGYDLDLAADGAEAIEKAKILKPALILLDFILPDMRGTEVCRRLAEDPETAQIPIILVSAKGAEIRQAYRDVGNVVSYIAKPFKPQVLTSIVAEVLEKSAAGELAKSAVTVHEGPAMPVTPVPPPTSTPLEIESTAARLAPDAGPSHPEPPSNGAAVSYGVQRSARANGHDDADEAEFEEPAELPTAVPRLSESSRREVLEVMFETLRASLEGVYVEEVDTPAGAAADESRSYTDLIERLGQQLEETRHHVRSGARYTLYGDGSVRSLDETLIDIFRRSCRLLFRAVVAGAVENESAPNPQRILVACHRDSQVHEQMRSLQAAHPEWQVFTVCERFRQLPVMTRLYGPTLVIAEATRAGALWDQLRVLQRLPEARQMTVIGVLDVTRPVGDGHGDPEAWAAQLTERGMVKVVNSAFDLEYELAASTDPERPRALDAPVPAETQAAG
jgi:CheY-like chemotaxis protein